MRDRTRYAALWGRRFACGGFVGRLGERRAEGPLQLKELPHSIQYNLPANYDPGRLRVVMVSPRNPLNIGAAARAMSNFGFTQLALVNPYDVAFREARSAVGAASLLENAIEYKTLAEAVAECDLVVGATAIGNRALQHPIRRLEYGARMMRNRLASGSVALLFGSEKFGLSNEDLSYCHWLIRIPTREEHRSMNLGQAVAVCMYELMRKPEAEAAEPEVYKPAAAADLDRLTEMLLETLQLTGYTNPVTAETTEEKTRRLVRRMNLSARDAQVWQGMVRQILWKLGAAEAPSRVE